MNNQQDFNKEVDKKIEELNNWYKKQLDLLSDVSDTLKDTDIEGDSSNPPPEHPGDVMALMISNYGKITTESINRNKPFTYVGQNIESYINKYKDLDNTVILAFCDLLQKPAEELIKINNEWIAYQKRQKELKNNYDNRVKKIISDLIKEHKELLNQWKYDLDLEVSNIKFYKNKTQGYLSYLERNEEERQQVIKNTDVDKILSGIISDMSNLTREEIKDKIFLAKNGLYKLVKSNDDMVPYEEVEKYKEEIKSLKNYGLYLHILIMTMLIINCVLTVTVGR